jgi:large subunit ribosomal protein L32
VSLVSQQASAIEGYRISLDRAASIGYFKRFFSSYLIENWSDSMLPVKKTSRTRTRTRRSHHHLTAANYSVCSKCDQAKLPHAACQNCGYVNPRITLKLGKKEESK